MFGCGTDPIKCHVVITVIVCFAENKNCDGILTHISSVWYIYMVTMVHTVHADITDNVLDYVL